MNSSARFWLAVSSLFVVSCGSKPVQTVGKRADAAPIVMAAVALKPVPIDLRVVGNVEAWSTISVKSLIGGELTRVFFTEGDFVKKGAQLFEIDPRPYQAALQQADANLARDQALLRQADANLARDIAQAEYAKAQAGRYERLQAEGVISREQADSFRTDAAARSEAVSADRASIESAKAALNADRAAIESARLQTEYCAIKSPVDGRTGNLAVKQGNIVKANDIGMVTINQVEPIYVNFAVPEGQLADIKKYMAGGKLPVIASVPDQPGATETGVLSFIDNSVDPTTGTIHLKGTYPNTDHKLWPGQFVQVTLRLALGDNAIVTPAEAVQTGQDGAFVFVVKKDNTVEYRPVTTGRTVGQETVIEKGLQPGENVVVEGHLRLVNGSRVVIKNAPAKSV